MLLLACEMVCWDDLANHDLAQHRSLGESDMAKKAAGTPSVQGDAGSATADGGKLTKTKAVRAALREGYSSPKEIAAHVKERYNIDISPSHVSNIKSKSKQGRNGRRGGKRRKPGRPKGAAGEKTAPRPTAAAGGLTANELDMVLQIARRMGGLNELRNYLDVLGRFRG